MSPRTTSKGFTLIELLVVIGIIGVLSSIVLVSLNDARKKARDARRLEDMRQIQIALELYRSNKNTYPLNTDNDCSGWDSTGLGSSDPFIKPLKDDGLMAEVSRDPTATGNCGGYRYYRYNAGTYGCTKAFYVLGVTDMETSGRPHPSSPGWKCGTGDWQTGFDWVTGAFE